MSVPKIPTNYTHNLNPIRPFDIDADLDAKHSGKIATELSGSVENKISGSLSTTNTLKLTGDANEPVATDNKLELMNLPRFTLKDIKDLMKQRVRIPNYSNVCFKMLGVEFFSICVGGESQIITEPYVPNAAERCEEDPCCKPDTRPFPDRNSNEPQG
ncbi:hypothetical protein [uncultured Marixanthomonas sp.]|uniref:hypothetical protein n=1 Tax=uncultured Marixanthomonas sp. TaxID=757245 RepID=UPI0030DA1872|tara:strand:+ start:19909 stop:20382 length:474 start_codon:yes stop_codon:yes gene_type:complete